MKITISLLASLLLSAGASAATTNGAISPQKLLSNLQQPQPIMPTRSQVLSADFSCNEPFMVPASYSDGLGNRFALCFSDPRWNHNYLIWYVQEVNGSFKAVGAAHKDTAGHYQGTVFPIEEPSVGSGIHASPVRVSVQFNAATASIEMIPASRDGIPVNWHIQPRGFLQGTLKVPSTCGPFLREMKRPEHLAALTGAEVGATACLLPRPKKGDSHDSPFRAFISWGRSHSALAAKTDTDKGKQNHAFDLEGDWDRDDVGSGERFFSVGFVGPDRGVSIDICERSAGSEAKRCEMSRLLGHTRKTFVLNDGQDRSTGIDDGEDRVEDGDKSDNTKVDNVKRKEHHNKKGHNHKSHSKKGHSHKSHHKEKHHQKQEHGHKACTLDNDNPGIDTINTVTRDNQHDPRLKRDNNEVQQLRRDVVRLERDLHAILEHGMRPPHEEARKHEKRSGGNHACSAGEPVERKHTERRHARYEVKDSCDLNPVDDHRVDRRHQVKGACNLNPIDDRHVKERHQVKEACNLNPIDDRHNDRRRVATDSCALNPVKDQGIDHKRPEHAAIANNACNSGPEPVKDRRQVDSCPLNNGIANPAPRSSRPAREKRVERAACDIYPLIDEDEGIDATPIAPVSAVFNNPGPDPIRRQGPDEIHQIEQALHMLGNKIADIDRKIGINPAVNPVVYPGNSIGNTVGNDLNVIGNNLENGIVSGANYVGGAVDSGINAVGGVFGANNMTSGMKNSVTSTSRKFVKQFGKMIHDDVVEPQQERKKMIKKRMMAKMRMNNPMASANPLGPVGPVLAGGPSIGVGNPLAGPVGGPNPVFDTFNPVGGPNPVGPIGGATQLNRNPNPYGPVGGPNPVASNPRNPLPNNTPRRSVDDYYHQQATDYLR